MDAPVSHAGPASRSQLWDQLSEYSNKALPPRLRPHQSASTSNFSSDGIPRLMKKTLLDTPDSLAGAWRWKGASHLPAGWLVLPPPAGIMNPTRDVKAAVLAVLPSVFADLNAERWMELAPPLVSWLRAVSDSNETPSIPEDEEVQTSEEELTTLFSKPSSLFASVSDIFTVTRLLLHAVCTPLVKHMIMLHGSSAQQPSTDGDAPTAAVKLLQEAMKALRTAAAGLPNPNKCSDTRSAHYARKQKRIVDVLAAEVAHVVVWAGANMPSLMQSEMVTGAHDLALQTYMRNRLLGRAYGCYACFAEYLAVCGKPAEACGHLRQIRQQLIGLKVETQHTAILVAVECNLAVAARAGHVAHGDFGTTEEHWRMGCFRPSSSCLRRSPSGQRASRRTSSSRWASPDGSGPAPGDDGNITRVAL